MNHSQVPKPSAFSGTRNRLLQPQISSLLSEVRALGHKLQRAAKLRLRQAERTGRDIPAYAFCLAEEFDNAIAQCSGRNQIICLAAAAEHGVLQWHHLSRGARTAGETSDRVLRALYWATSTRWHRANTAGMAPFDPQLPSSPPGNPTLCEHCQALQRDCRRYSPHSAMKDLREDTGTSHEIGVRRRFRCESCDVLWVRRMPVHEPFATWSIVRAGAP